MTGEWIRNRSPLSQDKTRRGESETERSGDRETKREIRRRGEPETFDITSPILPVALSPRLFFTTYGSASMLKKNLNEPVDCSASVN